jgi:hypothetical protein
LLTVTIHHIEARPSFVGTHPEIPEHYPCWGPAPAQAPHRASAETFVRLSSGVFQSSCPSVFSNYQA